MIDKATGLIVQENGDQGDCPCRTGIYLAYLVSTNQSYAPVLAGDIEEYLEISPNVYVRYSLSPSYNVPSDFSRDQASRLFLGLGMLGLKSKVTGYYKKVFLNWFRHPNGDFLGLQEAANNIRNLNYWFLYPLLLGLDLAFLYDSLFTESTQPWDRMNLFLGDLYLANKKYPTPLSLLSRAILNRTTAAAQVTNNLNNPANGPGLMCSQAYEANIWFLGNL